MAKFRKPTDSCRECAVPARYSASLVRRMNMVAWAAMIFHEDALRSQGLGRLCVKPIFEFAHLRRNRS